MTFSIVARCPHTGEFGVGALTALMGVGKLVGHASPGVGAAASQASMNPYLALDGLRLMAEGLEAPAALGEVLRRDPGRDVRQVGIVDRNGCTAAWTGERTPGWSGHLEDDAVVVSGNRLVGRHTLEAASEAFHAHRDRELAERLVLAVEAGESTGGDTEGARSGHVLVLGTEAYPLWDIRVDSEKDPAVRLRELFEEYRTDFLPEVQRLPTRRDPVGAATRELLGEDAGN
ncbi:DUF1028 domain-containing protein [Blastococcus sp. MG754426]|uniref:DUF1028 domain-containing protein n=1 Tax=unclassified Blastococcus TaxID=2619396 RepID=UPI001EEFC0CF|nr:MULTISPECIES: DUF1028 domain-containing protein [unclassified Blastococcus]MCF6509245.1 DUF1028 domain-containing protein [Blastococcus sp. MG754426]MCF6512446.1 DUF1028 domain-containing protein [Blastococcus sp. MG754427]